MEYVDEWKSHDLYLCAICIASGASLLSIEKGSNKFVTFILNISQKKAEETISRHWSRELKVPTRDLIEAIKELKTRIYSGV